MICIYLASPYTHKNKMIQELRAARVSQLAAKFQSEHRNVCVFSPIAHGHALVSSSEGRGMPTDYGFWQSHCEALISRLDELWVVMMNGWDKSVGVMAEIKYAKSIGTPVKYITEEGIFI